MEETFDPIAQTRANYYTPGSPVQFVRVELLKGSVSGDRAVCLTFKNISRVNLTALDIHFKCKSSGGEIICEDEFQYRDLEVKPGELFGMDDAVFITQKPITSVDVILKNVYNGKRVVQLDNIKRVRLPAPRRLPDDLAAALEERMSRKGMLYAPQVLENGWYCACGAFHPKEEDTVYCSECGSDRILLQKALSSLMQPEPAAEPEESPAPAPAEDATRIAAPAPEPTRIAAAAGEPARAAGTAGAEAGGTRAFEPVQPHAPESAAPRRTGAGQETRLFTQPSEPPLGRHAAAGPERSAGEDDTRAARPSARWKDEAARRDYASDAAEEEEPDDDRDPVAENIIRWVPPLTALICAGIALYGFVYYQLFL